MRAVEHLRTILIEVRAVPVGAQVALSVLRDFTYTDPTDPTDPGAVAAREHQGAALQDVLEEVLAYADALAPLRATARQLEVPVGALEGSAVGSS